VTGSQGFVGGHLRRTLVGRGCEVIGVDVPGRGAEIGLDLGGFDADALARQVGPLAGIIHLAARITRGSSVDAAARANLRTIAEAPVKLGEAWHTAHGPTHVVLCSTLKVYGPQPNPIAPTASPLRPEPHSYGSAKALAERLLTIAARRTGFSAAIVRLTFVYGPGQAPHNAIPTFLRACWRGEQPVVFGDGHELRDDVLVTDVADGLAEVCLRRAAGTFNAGGERARSLREVATLCCQAVVDAGGPTGITPRFDRGKPGKPWIDQSFDSSALHALLNHAPTPMLAGLTAQAAEMRPGVAA
jgi:nucleoside-diphosphate-sugar epimerase